MEIYVLFEFVNLVLDLTERNEIEDQEPPDEVTNNLENAAIFSIAKEYFAEENRGGRVWGFKCFYYGPFIPEEKLEKAREDYANYDDAKEKAIIYIDNSWVGRIIGQIDSSGIIMTNKYLYYKLYQRINDKDFSVGKISMENIKTFKMKNRFWGWLVINNGRKYKFMLTQFTWWDKRDSRVLEGLMQRFIQQQLNYSK